VNAEVVLTWNVMEFVMGKSKGTNPAIMLQMLKTEEAILFV